jgi:L-amino acid N-acyltransferase YncA
MMMRRVRRKDFKPIKRLFDEAYDEYLEFLQRNNPKQYVRDKRERQEVAAASFDFFLETGSSFVVEENHEVIGYVLSQTISDMHGTNDVLLVEYIVVDAKHRRRGVATALYRKLIDYAKRHSIMEIYATINPDNDPSIKLAQKVGFEVKEWKVATLSFR